jgi:hypothetical protein
MRGARDSKTFLPGLREAGGELRLGTWFIFRVTTGSGNVVR